VIQALREAGRPMSVSELCAVGASRATLSRMTAAGEIERAAYGVYRLPDPDSVHADWAALSKRVPTAVICLTSAARFHGITQDMPVSIEVAVPRSVGRIVGGVGRAFPINLSVMHWRDEKAFQLGVETHVIEGIPVRITSRERTVIDMFRFSLLNPSCRAIRISEESALDCLSRALDDTKTRRDEITRLAMEFGVREAMTPIIKAMNFLSPVV